MDGYAYENWCVQWLKKHGYKDVKPTLKSHDQGIDIIARKGSRTTGFQCKYYDHPVGNKAVQEAYSGAAFYGCDKAVVLTNATFTKSADELAEDLNVELWSHIEPSSRSRLKKLTNIFAFYLVTAGCTFFLYLCMHQDLPMRTEYVLSCIGIIMAGICTVIVKDSIWPFLFSFLLNLYPLFFFLFHPLRIILIFFVIPLLLLSLFCLIRFIGGMKQNLVDKGTVEKQEIRENMQMSAKELAKHFQILIEDELGHPLTLKEAAIEKDGILLIYESNKNITEELSLLAYSLSQLCRSENLDMQCEVKALNHRCFSVKLSNRV